MRSSFLSACVASVCAFSALPAQAGQPVKETVDPKKNLAEPCPPDTLNWIRLRSSYTGESDFERGDDAHGDAWWGAATLMHRTPLEGFLGGWPRQECGTWYLRLGAEYERFAFSNHGGLPIPNTLQSFAGVVALEYVVRDVPIISIEARPGFYYEHDVDFDDFDVPVTAYAPLYFKQTDHWAFGLVGGVTYRSFRSTPLIPALGFVFRTGKLTVFAIPPEPRIIYAATDKLSLWVGGEISGGSFRVDSHDYKKKPALNEAVVSYSEKRVAAGFSYKWENWTIDFGAGYAFERKFDYHRAEEGFETDEGAPFAKLELRAGF
jgi:hypothetical protein